MIDWIEELLGALAAEDEEEREDILALPSAEEAVPISLRGDRGEAGDGGTGDRSGEQTAGETVRPEPSAGEFWKDGPVWTVRGGLPEMDGTQRAAMADRTARAEEIPQQPRDGELIWTGLERAAQGGAAGLAQGGAVRFGEAQVGLEGLYRQSVRGLRPAAPALPPEQTGRTARAREPGSAASLAVDELDRAVRRDSRRYDGGMSIY